MSTPVSVKIKSIRESEGLTQKEFCAVCEFSLDSLKNYENDRRSPNLEAVQKLCTAFPQYTMYLMFEVIPANVGADQITPEEKKLRDLSTSEKTA